MRKALLLGLTLLTIYSCKDNLENPLEYREITIPQLNALFDITISYPIEFDVFDEQDTIRVFDTLTYQVQTTDIYNLVAENTNQFQQESNYDPELSVVSTQQLKIGYNYSVTRGRITTDSLMINGLDSVFVTANEFDQIYNQLGHSFVIPNQELSIFNFDTSLPIEETSFEIFSGPVKVNSLIFHPDNNAAPTVRRLFNIEGTKVIFGGFYLDESTFIVDEINQLILEKASELF